MIIDIGDWLPFGFTYTILMHNSNSYYAGWSGKDRSEANNYAEKNEYWGPYKGLVTNLWVGSSGNDHHSPTIENGYVAETVAKVNDGQITKYPYDLDKEIAKIIIYVKNAKNKILKIKNICMILLK